VVAMKPNVFWIAVILWIGVIFYFTSQPAEISRKQSGELLEKAGVIEESEVDISVPKNNRETYVTKAQNIIRKSAHVIEYLMLGILATMAVTYKQGLRVLNITVSFVLCLAIASLDEFIQKFVPGRGSLISDVGIDAIGFCVGIAIIILIELVVMYIGKYRGNSKISISG